MKVFKKGTRVNKNPSYGNYLFVSFHHAVNNVTEMCNIHKIKLVSVKRDWHYLAENRLVPFWAYVKADICLNTIDISCTWRA